MNEKMIEVGFARTGQIRQKREDYYEFWEADGNRLLFKEVTKSKNLLIGSEGFFIERGQSFKPFEKERQLQCGDTAVLLLTKDFKESLAKKEHLALIQSMLDWKTTMSAPPQHLAVRIAELLDANIGHLSYPLQEDDVVFVFGVRSSRPVSLMIGPPKNRREDTEIFHEFFNLRGLHIICGGTTATIASRYLDEPLEPIMESGTDEVPAMGKLSGVDIVTEGVITLQLLAEFAEHYYEDNRLIDTLRGRKDAVAVLARQVLHEANQVTVFLGGAVNPAHKELNIDFSVKQKAVERLVEKLDHMGKRVILKRC